MSSFVHPSDLGTFGRYKQASKIFSTTTRSSDPAWYMDPLELDHQWHIRFDGKSWTSALYSRIAKQWALGPEIPNDILENEDLQKSFIESFIRETQRRTKKALGVIVYLANDFATNELKAELNNPGALEELKDTAISDPKSILEDSSLDPEANSFRILPLPAAQDAVATAVTHTTSLASILQAARNVSKSSPHPVVAKAISAPLITILGLPTLLPAVPRKPVVSILQYPWFTVLAFFNEHRDLALIRTLQHRGTRRVGALRSALTASCASLEILDPDVFVISLAEEKDKTIEERIRSVLPETSNITTLVSDDPKALLPPHAKELNISATDFNQLAKESHTFEILNQEGWALQDFLPMPGKQAEIYPEQSEMRLLRIARRARLGVITLAFLLICLQLFKMANVIRQPEWTFDPADADVTKKQVNKLKAEQQRIFHWNNLLEDRSKGWVAMELLPQLMTPENGMLAKSFAHTTKPDDAQGQARAAIIKEWKITGYAKKEAFPVLDRLNTREGLDDFFTKIADVTGNRAYLPKEDTRKLAVNIRTVENSGYRPKPEEESELSDTSSYPFTFEMVITQRFEMTDPMAVNVTKEP